MAPLPARMAYRPESRACAPEGKSRNYAEAYKWYAAQVIPQIDSREVGSAFHPGGIRTTKAFHWAGESTKL